MKSTYAFLILCLTLVSCSGDKSNKSSSNGAIPEEINKNVVQEVVLEKGLECELDAGFDRRSVFIKILDDKLDIREITGKTYHTKNVEIEGLLIPTMNIKTRGHNKEIFAELSRSSMGRDMDRRVQSRTFQVKIKKGKGSIKVLAEKNLSFDLFKKIADLNDCKEIEVESPL